MISPKSSLGIRVIVTSRAAPATPPGGGRVSDGIDGVDKVDRIDSGQN
jgi:hypothetical protein